MGVGGTGRLGEREREKGGVREETKEDKKALNIVCVFECEEESECTCDQD